MAGRIVNGFLWLAALAGAVLAWQTGRERAALAEEHRRLARIAGELPIGDPEQVHIVALDTGEPLHFAWRVHFPANYRVVVTDGSGGQSSTQSSTPTDEIARIRIREGKDGHLECFRQVAGSSGVQTLGDSTLADLLQGRWGEIGVEQFGAGEVAVLAPDAQATLLRLTLPADLRERAAPLLARSPVGAASPPLLKIDLGPDGSNP